VPSKKTIEALKEKLKYEEATDNAGADIPLPDCISSDLPLRVKAWLRKYGISDNEISHFQFGWNPQTESLVFPIWNAEKTKLFFRQERYFGNKVGVPKYITYGEKKDRLGIIRNNLTPGTIILVEDFISAIKVARLCTSAPLLGSSIPAEALRSLSERFKIVRVWLDMDKATKSLQEASRAFGLFPSVGTILTKYDPKEYTTEEIKQYLIESLKQPLIGQPTKRN
jgi:hypothetical protein